MKKLLELRQQKAALKTQMRSMLDKADTEKRSLNEEEGQKFDELRAQADALEVEITRLEAVADDQRNLPGTSVEGEPVSNDELRHYIMTGDMGARPEAILFAITTAGSNVVSACKQHYDYCCQILAGEESNDSLFVLIYELDDESEVEQPEMWIKANPNLHVSVDAAKLESTIQKARGIPSQWVEMLTKRFNIWCQGSTPWMGAGAWDACALDYAEEDLVGMECYAGFDLSSTSDITSVSYAFPFEREIRLLTRHYLPEAQLLNVANKNRAIYRQWVKAGWIRTTPGDCIDYDRIRDDILRDAETFNIRLVGFDTWNATHLRTQLQGAGLDVEPFPQTYLKFSPVAKSFEVFVNRKVVRHRGDPVLAWAIGNVVMESDANANIKPNKKKSSNKIDPAVSALMAFGTFQAEHEDFAFDMSDSHKERLALFNGI